MENFGRFVLYGEEQNRINGMKWIRWKNLEVFYSEGYIYQATQKISEKGKTHTIFLG
jgi:hypothetical protein